MAFQLLQDCNDMDCKMTSTDHAVLMVLCRFANDAGQECFPSTAEIARCSHFATIPVRKALNSLQESGWISSTQKAGLKRYFTINVARIKKAVKGKAEPLQNLAGDIDQDPRIDQYPPIDQDPRIDQNGDPVSINTQTPYQSIPRKEQEEIIEENIFSAAPSFDDAVPEPPDDFFLDSFPADLLEDEENKKKPQEKKKAKKTKTASANQPLVKPEDCSQEVFDEWVGFKNSLKGKAKCSQRMVSFIADEARKAGITSEKAMIICMERGWQSFQANYNTGSSSSSSSTDNSWRVTPQQQREIEEIMAQRKAAQHHQEPSFRNLSTSAKDEFDAGALDLVRGIL